MSKSVVEKCLICAENMGLFKNDLNVCSGFSERPIFQLFGETFIFWIKIFYLKLYDKIIFRNLHEFEVAL
jgi:hypothetical protein